MKLHYYESILNFYCDSLTEEELLEKIREWTLRYLWYRKKREEEGGNENTHTGFSSVGEDRSDIGLRGLQREGTLFLGRQQGQNHRYN